jgi:hypothetical protein
VGSSLYALNNCLLKFHIEKNNEEISENLNNIPSLNPEIYTPFEVDYYGVERELSSELGTIGNNYFNSLMETVMDDFHSCLNNL